MMIVLVLSLAGLGVVLLSERSWRRQPASLAR